jgi:hypothetical protein
MRAPTRLAAALAAALIAAPAAAGDLTGVWKGKFKCTLQDGQSKQKLSSRTVAAPEAGVSTLELTHPDGPDSPALQIRIDNVLFAGFMLVDAGGASGVGAIVDCNPNQDPGTGYGELRTFRWRAAPGAIAGSISWRGMLVDDDAVIGSCRGSWRRVSREDPGVSYCR